MRIAFALGVALALAGCSALPSQGPNASEVSGEATFGPGEFPRYLVTPLAERAVEMLARSREPTLHGSFGERRGAPSQVVGVGDAIAVTVWEAAAGGLFSANAIGGVTAGSRSASIPEQTVGRDGTIAVPYAGRIRVTGLTPPQIEQAIVHRLEGKAIEPQALVTVARNVSSTVTVLGEVSNGARVPLTARGDRVLDVIASAGGIRAPVHESFVSLSRGGSTVRAPMQALLARPSENIYVQPNDVITVVREPQTFSVFGATGRNALVPFEAIGITLEEALAKAGGLSDWAANPQGVFLFRSEPASIAAQLDPAFPIGAPRVNVVYQVNMKDAATYFLARRFAVRNKDIIYVANAPVTDIYKVMQVFATVAQPAMTGAALAK